MAEHKLKKGLSIIEALSRLGTCLGYHVTKEFRVQSSGLNFSAVDVAWFIDSSQTYPIMVFEVESKATSSMAHNAMKVFARPTTEFEKPLFFFHVVVASGKHTSRIEELMHTYGKNNYRVYRIDHDDKTRLLEDVLAQHRRIKSSIPIPGLFSLTRHDEWKGTEFDTILEKIEALKFSELLISTYAKLIPQDAVFLTRYIQLLSREIEVNDLNFDGYDYGNFIGGLFAHPLHLAILSRAYPEKAPVYFESLHRWQSGSYREMIGPYFSLSMDEYEFTTQLAASYLASVAAVFGPVLPVREYLSKILRGIVKEMVKFPREISFFSGLWLLHLSASLQDRSDYEFARKFINARGGVSHRWLFSPPFQLPFETEEWDNGLMLDSKPVPELIQFREQNKKTHPDVLDDKAAILFGIGLLVGPEWEQDPSNIIKLLQ